MADPRGDRHTYLARVADRLRLPGPVAAEVLEELEAHIADSAAALTAEGLAPEGAEREALARLGNPGELGDGIRRAKQTRRRLLVAAGHGVLAAIRGFVWGGLFAGAITTLASVLALIVLSTLMRVMDISASGFSTWSSWLTLPYVTFAVGYAGHRVPGAMATRSMRPVSTLQWPVALLGGAAVGAISVLGVRVAMDLGLFWTLVMAPVAFAAGALVSNDRPGTSVRIRVGWRTVVLAVVVLTLGSSALGFATMQVNEPGDRYLDRAGPMSPYAGDVLPAGVGTMGGGGSSGGRITQDLIFDPPTVPAGWSSFQLELWREVAWVNGQGPWAPDSSGPVVSVPMVTMTDPASFSGELRIPITKQRTTYSIAVTGLGPDGRRYTMYGPDTGFPGTPWVGTAWEWLTTP